MQTPLLLLLVLVLRKLRNKRTWCMFQISSASCTSIDSKLLGSNALMFLKKRSKTLMWKACHLFKSLSLLTLKACPLYHLRISHLVIPLITLWVFIFSVWPHDLDSLPNILRNQLVLILLSPTTAETLPATILDSKSIICLPYSLVPSLDITSQSYQKAVMMLHQERGGWS